MKFNSFPGIAKFLLKDLPTNDYPVLNSRLFCSIWFTIAKHTKVDMIWFAGRSPTSVAQNLKATTLTYLAIWPISPGNAGIFAGRGADFGSVPGPFAPQLAGLRAIAQAGWDGGGEGNTPGTRHWAV